MSTLKVGAIRGVSASSDAITVANDGTCTAKITNNLSNRNLIINGAMQVAQRGTSSTNSGYHTIDRFHMSYGGQDEAPTQAQVDVASGTTPYTLGFRKAAKITNGNQTSSVGATDFSQLLYRMEAQDIANSGWNYTSSSSYITFSFWIKSSVSQVFTGSLRTVDGTSQSYKFDTPTLSANTWTKVTKTIPGNSNLQFDNNNAVGLDLYLFPFLGQTYTSSNANTETWITSNTDTYGNNQTTTWWTTNDATCEFTGIQLEVGSVATDFEHKSFGQHLAKCQRYYYRISADASGQGFGMGYQTLSAQAKIFINFPVTMRSKPTAVETSGTASDYSVARTSTYEVCNVVPVFSNATIYSAQVVTNQTQASLNTGQAVLLRANTTDFFLGFSGEI